MRKARMFLVLGVWVAILPYLGFPFSLKNILLSLSGIYIIYLSYTLYTEYKKEHQNEEKKFDNFRENSNFTETGDSNLN